MVKMCIYIANDGTLFYDQNECAKYEATKIREAVTASIIGVKKDGTMIECTNPYYFLWEADIMICKNQEGIAILHELRNTSHSITFQDILEDVNEPGIYHWDEDAFKWVLTTF